MTEDLEYLLSQYADGTLDPEQRLEVEQRLDRDQEARQLLQSYRALEGALQAAGPVVPAFDYDDLFESINQRIDQHEQSASQRLRILPWSLAAAGLAAACLWLAMGIGFRPAATSSNNFGPTVAIQSGPANRASARGVVALLPDRGLSAGPSVSIVHLNPPTRDAVAYAVSEALIDAPNTLFIAKANDPAQDTSRILY